MPKSDSHWIRFSIGASCYLRFFFKKWAITGLFYFIFIFSIHSWQLTKMCYINKILPMTGFEPWTSGIRSDRSTNWATSATSVNFMAFVEGKFWPNKKGQLTRRLSVWIQLDLDTAPQETYYWLHHDQATFFSQSILTLLYRYFEWPFYQSRLMTENRWQCNKPISE